MRSASVKVAAIAQLCSTSDKLSNLAAVAQCAGMAKRAGACMLFLPECFGFLGENSEQTLQNAEPPVKVDADKLFSFKNNDLDEPHQAMCAAVASIVSSTSSNKISDASIMNEQFLPYESYPSLSELKHKYSRDQDTLGDWRILPALQTIAKESGLWISAGGMHEKQSEEISDTPKVYNTHVIVNSSGSIVTTYRKIHLFDVCIPSQNINLRESATTAPGTKLVVCPTPLGMLGLSTCYDLRFPEMFTALTEKGNAQLIAVPSAFTVPTGKAHWHTLLKARAIENQCFVLAAAQYGRHNIKRESYGHALGVGPWGDVLADAGGEGESLDSPPPPSIVTCEIDLEEMERVRERMPIQTHRNNAKFSF